MELRTLQYFLTVAREENITRASEVLHITQPTLSRQMKQLEQELGTELFMRGRNFALTEAGMLLRRRAEEVIDLLYKIESEIAAADDVAGIISIDSGALKSSQFLPEVMSAFQKLHPKVRFEIYSNSSQYIKERLDRGLLDFGILLEPVDIEEYEYLRLPGRERWGLFMCADNQLAQKSSISRSDLLGVPLIIPSRLYVQKEISNWLGADINKLNVLAAVNLMTHAAMFINSGIACGLTIEGAVDLFEDDKLAFSPLEPELAFTSVLAWKRFQPVGNAAAKFLEYIKIMQKAHIKNAPRKTARCVKQAYKSVFFKYNFAVFKGFYARQRFQMVTGVNNALMARLEGFFDYNADACNLAACLVGNIGKAERRFAVSKKIVDNKYGFAFVQKFFEDAYIAGNFFGEAVNFGGVGRAAHKFRFLLAGKNYRYMQAQCGC